MLDHIVYAVPDVSAAVQNLTIRLGVAPIMGGKHQGLGTHNALLSLSEMAYLEIIGPDPDQPTPSMPRPFAIDTLSAPRLRT